MEVDTRTTLRVCVMDNYELTLQSHFFIATTSDSPSTAVLIQYSSCPPLFAYGCTVHIERIEGSLHYIRRSISSCQLDLNRTLHLNDEAPDPMNRQCIQVRWTLNYVEGIVIGFTAQMYCDI